ncbi:MAG: N-acetylmannosamine-6-phosphate 2-epimerase [Bacillaceae bacterium]
MEIFKRGLIVSCQALEGEPLHGDDTMVKMAIAAEQGGAIGFRLNGVNDIIKISNISTLPKIGIIKKKYEGFDVIITPSMHEVELLVESNPEVIALDATFRKRPDFSNPTDFITHIKANYNVKIMADVSTYEEGIAAEKAGADFIGTTLSSYTSYTQHSPRPNLDLISALVKIINVPLIAEGNFITPDQAVKALELGAHAVVVGGAITRPQQITERFSSVINNFLI